MLGRDPTPGRPVDGTVFSDSKLAPCLLLGLFAVLTAAIGGVTWRFAVVQREAVERGVQSQLLTVADTKVRQIAEWRRVRLGEARSIMADSITLAAFERVIEGRATPAEHAAVEEYLRSILGNLRYAGAALVNPEGRPVLLEGRTFGDSARLKGLMQRVMQARDVVERDFDIADSPETAHLGLNLPLRAGAGGAVFGGLLLSVDPQDYLYPLQTWPVPSRSAEVVLVRREGQSVLFLRRREQLNLFREHYESEIAHRALVEQYNNLSRYANDVILLFDGNGTIVTANDRAADVYGYGVDQFHGMNIRQLRALASRPFLSAEWQLAKERGSVIFETVHQRRDGSEFAVEVSTRSIVVEGKCLQQSIIRDISDRKCAEQELSESEARFRQLVESAPHGILVVEGPLILYANPEAVRLFGAAVEADLVGHSLLERTRPDEHEAMQRRFLDIASVMPSPVAERRYLRLNGEEFWAAVSCAEIDYNRRPAALLFYRDITAAKQAGEEHTRLEEQLRQSQKMECVGLLAGGVAHDFNNYLTVINGYCEMLLGGPEAGPEIRDSLQEIHAAGERAASLTQQLLCFSRKQIATPRILNLDQVVRDSGQLLRRLIGEDVEIVTRLDAQPGNVLADPLQMGQVLMNLVINARDAMPGGGQIAIETGKREIDEAAASRFAVRPGRYAVLSVADTGVGMSPEVQERVFEPFFTTKGVGKGTGLGLSTAYGIVRQAGGWIDVRSSPGAGSRFEIWLPLSEAGPAEGVAPETAAEGGRGEETLLIVEDQADVRRLALSILQADGYRLLQAGDAEQALGLSASYAGKIDLLVTDVIMPGLNGRQLADRLVEERPGLKVLYTSGYTADVMALQGYLEPGMEYLPKPFGAAQLSAKVRKVLGPAGR